MRASAHVLLLSATIYMLLAERLFLKLATGGSGILPILDLWIPLLALMLMLSSGRSASLRFLSNQGFRVYWLPYILTSAMLPGIAFFFADYPLRTLIGYPNSVLAISFLMFGSWIACSRQPVWNLTRKYLFAAILIECIVATAQFAYLKSLVSSPILRVLYDWDIATQSAWSDRYILTARSIGTFVNPNDLGFWAVMAFWASVLMLQNWQRHIAAYAALVTLLFSQSRGSVLALLGSISIWVLYLALSRDTGLKKTREAVLVTLLLCIAISIGASIALSPEDLQDLPGADRLKAGLLFIVQDTGADENAAGRVEAWQQAVEFYGEHPLGTIGEPKQVFPYVLDNDYVRLFLQGTPLYVLIFVLLLYGGIRSITWRGASGRAIAMFSSALAINSLTAHPLSYPVMALYWMTVARYLVESRSGEVQAGAALRSFSEPWGGREQRLVPGEVIRFSTSPSGRLANR